MVHIYIYRVTTAAASRLAEKKEKDEKKLWNYGYDGCAQSGRAVIRGCAQPY
jgi:hypothetical protein